MTAMHTNQRKTVEVFESRQSRPDPLSLSIRSVALHEEYAHASQILFVSTNRIYEGLLIFEHFGCFSLMHMLKFYVCSLFMDRKLLRKKLSES